MRKKKIFLCAPCKDGLHIGKFSNHWLLSARYSGENRSKGCRSKDLEADGGEGGEGGVGEEDAAGEAPVTPPQSIMEGNRELLTGAIMRISWELRMGCIMVTILVVDTSSTTGQAIKQMLRMVEEDNSTKNSRSDPTVMVLILMHMQDHMVGEVITHMEEDIKIKETGVSMVLIEKVEQEL